MQQKLCLWLVLVVLFGALCLGNPFLPCGAAAPAGSPGASPAAVPAASPTEPSTMQAQTAPPAATPAIDVQLAAAGGAASAGARGRELAAESMAAKALAVVPASARRSPSVALRAEPSAEPLLPACPDADLADQVIAVEQVGDEPVWVLRDGRRLVRNPIVGGRPLLVPFGDGK